MKSILAVLFYTGVSSAFAGSLVCSPSTIKSVKAEVESRASKKRNTDKNMHCAVSCLLTLKCRSGDVLALGIGKEIYDMFTPGDADLKDMKADIQGIDLAKSGRARNKAECFTQCDSYYR